MSSLTKSFVIGLNAFHGDSSACLLENGELVAAAEEERFRRIKHWAGFPSESIKYCLSAAGIELNEVDHIAINQDSKANLGKKASYVLTKRPDLGLVLDRLRNKKERKSVGDWLDQSLGTTFKGTIHQVEHHLCHLASAFHVGPFDEAVAVSVDGFGDFASAAWGYGKGAALKLDQRVYFPHSLGIFYQAMTQYLGFPNYGDEYKVMGLAPYGAPHQLEQMRQIVRLLPGGHFELNLDFFRHHKEKIAYEWESGEPSVGDLFSDALSELLGPRRQKTDEVTQYHKDLARSTQAMYEEAFFHLLEAAHDAYKSENIVLAGGCAMNSVANGKVLLRSKFKRMYVQSAAGDAGGAIGAAFAVWHKINGDRDSAPSASAISPAATGSRFVMDHAYWGPKYSDDEIGQLLGDQATAIQQAGCHSARLVADEELFLSASQAIADGQVVGWFQGRMEWGPRALGNRSILCDPRRADMKDILNLKIKRRESFRPFAPSILRERAGDWFEVEDDVPFMMQVYQIRESKRPLIPAVTHVDGSGRLQTVYRETNERYHRLIEAFEKLTSVPLVLNTSFNENEPVVCKPQEAIDCFLRTRMDMLVLGNWIVQRKPV